jgi:hypothetical protein
MFVRFRETGRRLQCSLIETRRANGKVQHEHIGSLGAVPISPLSRRPSRSSRASVVLAGIGRAPHEHYEVGVWARLAPLARTMRL